MKMEQTECSETSAYNIQTPGNYPKESIQHTEQGESLKSRKPYCINIHYNKIYLVYLIPKIALAKISYKHLTDAFVTIILGIVSVQSV